VWVNCSIMVVVQFVGSYYLVFACTTTSLTLSTSWYEYDRDQVFAFTASRVSITNKMQNNLLNLGIVVSPAHTSLLTND
jgi:hypothetical protein